MIGTIIQVVYLLYLIFGAVILLINMEYVLVLPWNKHRYRLSVMRRILVDVLEYIFWPYTLWRVYKLK